MGKVNFFLAAVLLVLAGGCKKNIESDAPEAGIYIVKNTDFTVGLYLDGSKAYEGELYNGVFLYLPEKGLPYKLQEDGVLQIDGSAFQYKWQPEGITVRYTPTETMFFSRNASLKVKSMG